MKNAIMKSWDKQCYLAINEEGEIIIDWLTEEYKSNNKIMKINADNYASMIDYLIAIKDISSGYLQAIDTYGTIEERDSKYYDNIFAIYNEAYTELDNIGIID